MEGVGVEAHSLGASKGCSNRFERNRNLCQLIPLVFFVVSWLETLGGIVAERNLKRSFIYSAENDLRSAALCRGENER